MRDMQGERRADRSNDLTAIQRRMALDLISGALKERQGEVDGRPHFEVLGRRQRLHRQPWRHSRRPHFEPLSVMEIIRRYEASHGLN